MSATVTAVVPVYNDVTHLPSVVEQLLAQRSVALDIVLVDDGSTDGSAAVGMALAATNPTVRYVAMEHNGGVARARERGVAEAIGVWVWFVDSDDAFPDDAASRLLAAADDAVDAVVGAARFVHPGGSATIVRPPDSPGLDGTDAFEAVLRGRITGHLWNKLFRRTVLQTIKYVPAKVQSDLAMTAQAIGAARRVVFVRDIVYEYRIRAGSIISTQSRRSESLALIDRTVAAVATRLGVQDGDAYRYFHLRYIVLSGFKDAQVGDYRPDERRQLRRALRRSIGAAELRLLIRLRDWRRLAFAVAARTSTVAHRLLLRLADRS